MRLILDHCVPRRLGAFFGTHRVSTASEMGWERFRNGALLAAAGAAGFDALITVDQNLRHQQNLAELPIAVVVMCSASNDIDDLKRMMPRVLDALRILRERVLIEISEEGPVKDDPRAGPR